MHDAPSARSDVPTSRIQAVTAGPSIRGRRHRSVECWSKPSLISTIHLRTGLYAAGLHFQMEPDMTIEVVDHLPQWYVVHTNPKQEDRADSNLRCWGVETLHPKLKTRRVNEFTGALTYLTKPMFPRYLFAKFNARKQLAKISFTRGVHHVVSFGGQPTPVEDEIIEIMRARIDENGFVNFGEELKQGDKVVIKAGPLRDFEGVFERELNDSERISVLLTTITYQGRVVVSRDLLERASG